MGTTKNDPDHGDTVRRAALPEVLFVPDLALALGLSESAARRAILRGDCGPFLRMGRRLAVLRESFLTALETRQVSAPGKTLQLLRPSAPSGAPTRTDSHKDGEES